MSDFQLGQRVKYSTQIRRRHATPGEFLGPDKLWSTFPGAGLEHLQHPGGEGIIVGQRTLTEGKVSYWPEGPGEYAPSRTFTAYLVAYAMRRKPVHVLPEHIEVLP